MTILPTVDQFPTFADTSLWLTEKACQCIWYLPNRRRCCLVGITDKVNQSALHLAQSILEAKPSTKSTLQILADIAERSCCGRHHRNKIWGSGLLEKLAIRWQNEIQVTLFAANYKLAQTVKLESVSPSDQTIFSTQFLPPSKPAAFVRYEVLKGETLRSKLLSPIDPRASKVGSLYIFTYTKDAFEGMIKIGYTGGFIDFRLSDWAQCGHGYPKLLASYDGVQHPERVELLTHFELRESWYAQRWCELHLRAHIEWFKTDIETASSICRLWSQWMERANPYNRRGHLKSFWEDNIDFLIMHQIPITAKVMIEIQEIEEGSIDVLGFIDDDMLRQRNEPVVKQE